MATKVNEKSVFEVLSAVDCNEHTEKKGNLTYLTWSWAWAEVKKRYPNATYEIYHDEQKRPYFYDENLGYMCYTKVTIEGETLEMWLPVMDSTNKALKSHDYKVGNRTVYAATMFDINKTIMRCLVKNLAMFGLGHYIYAGEDLPEAVVESNREAEEARAKLLNEAARDFSQCKTVEDVREVYFSQKYSSLVDMKDANFLSMTNQAKAKVANE